MGGDATRPSIGSASGVLKIIVQRQNGPRPADDSLIVFGLPGGRPFSLPTKLKVLRIAREGNYFSVSYALNRKDFVPVFRLEAPDAAMAPSQKFFLGGFAGGDPQGAYARFRSFKINGRETFK